jgi:hypothetical protein
MTVATTVATAEAVQAPNAKRRRWLIPVVVVILALLCIGGIILAFHWPFSSQNVMQSVQEDWPGKINVQRFHRTYFPHPGCVLEDVTLTRGSETSGPPLVAIQKVTIAANYHDLLLRPGYVSAILLEGLKISVPAEQGDEHAPAASQQASNSDKTSKSSSSSVRLGQVFTKDAVLEIATKSDGPLKFEIHELTLKSITHDAPMTYDLAMRNPQPPGEIRARGKLGPWDSQHLDTVPLSGAYTFDKADLGVYGGIAGTLSAKGQFQGVLGKIETQGTTDIPDFEVTRGHHPVALKTKFIATVDGTGGDTILRSVDGMFLHTSVHVDGSVASKPGKPGKTTSLNLNVQGGHIEDLLRLFNKESKPPMEGVANIKARVLWPSSEQPFLKRISLQGEFDITHARWENPERQANVNDLSKRASGNKKDANTPDVTADIKGSVALSQAIATLHDVSCSVPGAEATLSGTYNLGNAKIDFHGDLKTVSALSNETSGVKSVLLKPLDPLFKRKHSGAVVPVAMTGTYSDPHFGISLPEK